jgi:hypothetical protein
LKLGVVGRVLLGVARQQAQEEMEELRAEMRRMRRRLQAAGISTAAWS